MVWWYAIVFVVSVVVSYLVSANASEATSTSTSLEEVSDVPTAEAGGSIPVVFGTYLIKSSNIVWYGDPGYVALKD